MPDFTAESTSKTRDTRQLSIPQKYASSLSRKYNPEQPPYSQTTITRSDLVSRRRLFHTHGMNKDLSRVSNSSLEALMWKITTRRGLTLQEVLIIAAMNAAPILIATDKGERTIWRSRSHRDSLGLGDCHGKSD
jgi:hypothetical protein